MALAVAINIPRFYFASINSNKMQIVANKKLEFTELRKNGPLKDADWTIYTMRYIYKFIRLVFCTFSYYFMPFLGVSLNMRYLVPS